MKLIVIAAFLAAGCVTARPLGSFTTLPPDTPKECTRLCQSMGLLLTAVVVVADSAGCVCEAQPGTARPAGATAAASGGAVIAARAAAAAAQQQQMQQAQQPPPPAYVPIH
ncbi:MAG TPA: hypothetical protein VMK66_18255 [Myxococcales bacterium]|nr:hypothetical protein [Myxococcales bacterium]